MGEVGDVGEIKTLESMAVRSVLVIRLDGDEGFASSGDNDSAGGVLAPNAGAEGLVTDHAIAAGNGAIILAIIKRNNGRAILHDALNLLFQFGAVHGA